MFGALSVGGALRPDLILHSRPSRGIKPLPHYLLSGPPPRFRRRSLKPSFSWIPSSKRGARRAGCVVPGSSPRLLTNTFRPALSGHEGEPRDYYGRAARPSDLRSKGKAWRCRPRAENVQGQAGDHERGGGEFPGRSGFGQQQRRTQHAEYRHEQGEGCDHGGGMPRQQPVPERVRQRAS